MCAAYASRSSGASCSGRSRPSIVIRPATASTSSVHHVGQLVVGPGEPVDLARQGADAATLEGGEVRPQESRRAGGLLKASDRRAPRASRRPSETRDDDCGSTMILVCITGRPSSERAPPCVAIGKEVLAKEVLALYGPSHDRTAPAHRPVIDVRAWRALAHPLRTRLLGLPPRRTVHVDPAGPARRREQRLDELPPAPARRARLRRGRRRPRRWPRARVARGAPDDELGARRAARPGGRSGAGRHGAAADSRARPCPVRLGRSARRPRFSLAPGRRVQGLPAEADARPGARLGVELDSVLERWLADHPADTPTDDTELVSVLIDVLPPAGVADVSAPVAVRSATGAPVCGPSR